VSTLTARTRKALEEEGYLVATVEYYNAFSKRKHDLFGCFDLLAISPGHRVFVQVTSDSNASSRRGKILSSPYFDRFVSAGFSILLSTWSKDGRFWVESREWIVR